MNTDFQEYKKQAETRWGETAAYQEYREKSKGCGAADNEKLQQDMMNIFAEFASLDCGPADAPAQSLVRKLQEFITEHFYHCTNEILAGLGKIYVADSAFKNNIDGYADEGTEEFVSKAIEIYTK